MRDKIYAAMIMSCSVALTFVSSQALGGSGATTGARSASTHSNFRASATRPLHFQRRRNKGAPWPTTGGAFYYGPTNGEPQLDVTIPADNAHYTCTYDIPWDWVHRCPPSVGASEPPPELPPVVPYVRGCPSETVTVPRGDGKEQTVTIVRC
jgi:hypothetical protein